MEIPTSKICRNCQREFNKLPKTSYKQWSRQFCCSKICGDKSKQTPWLRKFDIKKGQHLSPATQFKKGEQRAEKNNKWRGDDVSYSAIHHWVTNNWGRPSFCEHCKTSARNTYDWANISDEYKRDRNDWLRLCRPCHSKYDRQKKK